jgi:ABC-type Fe3+-siderophore transport system permease subunit
VACHHGTLIEGEFRMHPSVKVFMIVWFSFLGVLFVKMLISVGATRSDLQSSSVRGLMTPVAMAAFGVALIKFGRYSGRSEETAIVSFLKSTFETNDDA